MAQYEPFIYETLDELRRKIQSLGLDISFSEDLSVLAAPAAVGGRTAPNRFSTLPMEGRDSLPDGSPGELTFRRYRRYGAGGWGLIQFEACAVWQGGRSSDRQMCLQPSTEKAIASLLEAARAEGAALLEVSPAVFGTLSDTVASQGVIAVASIRRVTLPPRAALILVLDKIRDPGNLGAILRSAEAAAVSLVVLAPGCVDPWNPKVVRSGMGAHFRLPLVPAPSWDAVAQHIGDRPVWLAAAHRALPYDRVDWTAECALIIGSEAAGLSAEAEALGTGHVTIPMAGPVESLNAAMATTVLLFEAARQRRQQDDRSPQA